MRRNGAIAVGDVIRHSVSVGAARPRVHPMAHPRAYTPKHLAERILRSRSALEGERKPVTVLFVDVVDSIRLSERAGAEAWHRVLDRFFALLADAIHRFEGTINQYTGDGVMALFGAPLAHEDHAQRACHAALLIREQLRVFAAELRRGLGLRFATRVGLNSGEVIVGAIGDDLRMDYTAQGHTVGLAARMQQSAGPGRVRLTAGTAALVAPYFELAPGRSRIKGVSRLVKTFELIGPGANRTRIEASRARGFSRFVGRERELEALDRALGRATDGDGGAVGVFGAPGVGKSRLCQDAADRWQARGVSVAQSHCPPHGKALPFAALLELLESFLGLAADERPPTRRKKVRDGLRTLRSAGPDDARLVLEFLGLGKDPGKLGSVDARARRERLFALVCGLVQARSARTPTLLVFDDAQWMDAESETFLAHLVDAVGFTRTLLLLNARPEYTAPWMKEPRFERIELAPLAGHESNLLLRELLGDDPALAELRARVQTHAAGNPFFAEETVQSLFERGALVRENGAVRLAAPVETLELPVGVQSLIAARIDALPGSAKHVLQLAAVIGKRFAEPVLRAALGDDAAELGDALRALQAADLVHPESADPSAPFTFTHPLTQEVAYAVQLQEARTERHHAVALALQEVFAARLGQHAALLAHHWAAAGQRAEAARWKRFAALQVTNIQLRRPLPPGARERRR